MNQTKTLVDHVRTTLLESQRVQSLFFSANAEQLVATAEVMAHCFQSGHKVLLFGNGGSAADAQHIATEFVGRIHSERPSLPALSLSTDTSLLTALGNDYGFEAVFSRQIEGLGMAGDTAIAISTSGNSPNVLRGLESARRKGMYTVGLTGETGGKMRGMAETLFCVPSRQTPRIQEVHIMIGHYLSELAEQMLFPDLFSA